MSRDTAEVKQFGAFLLAASKQIGKHCDDVNDQFIICKAENANPAFCVEIGKKVTQCAISVYAKLPFTMRLHAIFFASAKFFVAKNSLSHI